MVSTSSTLFPPSRDLLYPQFETYRLHSLSPTDDVLGFPLPGSGATQSRLEHGHHTLSFKETRDRIGWDHLAVDAQGRGLYVDRDWNVFGFVLEDDLTPRFSILAALPQPISSASSSSAPAPEYPSIAPLHSGYWAVSTGSGSLYILHTSPNHSSGVLTSLYHLPPGTDSPFLIRAARHISDTDGRLLLSRAIPDPDDTEAKGRRSTKRVFELLEVLIDPSEKGNADVGREMEVKWTLRGGDLPIHCSWVEDGWMVLSGETYGPAKEEDEEMLSEAEKEKKARDARIGKLGLGASLPPTPDQVATSPAPAPPTPPIAPTPPPDQPLTWSQTGDSATIHIPFAAGTSRPDISISLNPLTLSLALRSGPSQPEALQQFLRYPERSWWADIDPSLSSFSFDTTTSTLDIDLTKVDSNHRWPSLFLPSDSDDEDAEIPEILSAATLASVREAFNNVRTRGPDEPEGNHPAIPSLLREEMDFDMEDGEDFEDRAAGAMGDGSGKVGREVFVGMLRDGEAKWSKGSTTVVSLPLQSGSQDGQGVIVKSAVDGLLFTPSSDPAGSPWLHQSTTPALAFVLSSKRDIRLVRHLSPPAGATDPHPTVLALDSGSSSAGQGNVYVYYPLVDKTMARQGVVRVSGLERGAALGVAKVRREKGNAVVVLCERELVVLSGVV